jgi:hypothetical protein
LAGDEIDRNCSDDGFLAILPAISVKSVSRGISGEPSTMNGFSLG